MSYFTWVFFYTFKQKSARFKFLRCKYKILPRIFILYHSFKVYFYTTHNFFINVKEDRYGVSFYSKLLHFSSQIICLKTIWHLEWAFVFLFAICLFIRLSAICPFIHLSKLEFGLCIKFKSNSHICVWTSCLSAVNMNQILANLGPISRFVDDTNSRSLYPKARQIWNI